MNTEIKNKLIPFSSLDEASVFVRENKGMYISMNLQALVDETIIDLLMNPNVYGYADGIGAQVFLNRKCGVKTVKIPGCELWLNILQQEKSKSYSIAIIGSSPETNTQTVAKLKREFPNHNISYFVDGYNFEEEQLLGELSSTNVDMVFIALGQPRQEVLGNKILNVIPNVTVLGLGGSFDVFCGVINRAPKFFITLHIEWLYRILLEPKRSIKLAISVSRYFVMMLKS
ncbi:WecB/TagA/CpsF family glycosyltransferase [Shewanella sp. HL-SH4]|uniref:WecB/TagA/CpsF family glycosyltransferase n=1 Tax=Shewanella sp. HL-SH4 TaxID=3436240 RepID=UPI003EBD6F91